MQDTPYGLGTDETIAAQVMGKLGYSVHGIGKWHLGHCSWDHTPVKRGFETFYGFFNGALDAASWSKGRVFYDRNKDWKSRDRKKGYRV